MPFCHGNALLSGRVGTAIEMCSLFARGGGLCTRCHVCSNRGKVSRVCICRGNDFGCCDSLFSGTRFREADCRFVGRGLRFGRGRFVTTNGLCMDRSVGATGRVRLVTGTRIISLGLLGSGLCLLYGRRGRGPSNAGCFAVSI